MNENNKQIEDLGIKFPLCDHEYELTEDHIDLKRIDGSILQVGRMECSKCDEFLPGMLEICLDCIDRQDPGSKEKIMHGILPTKVFSTCEICLRQSEVAQVVV